jgi:hypothetical protein
MVSMADCTTCEELTLAPVGVAAGLATHVGLAIFEEPERFVIAHEPAPLAA